MVLLIGYGNPGRGDDGLGPALAERLARRAIPGLHVKTDFQLKVEHTLDVASADLVVFADAQMDRPTPFDVTPTQADKTADIASHDLTPGAVLSLAALLFGAAPEAYILGLTGVRFGHLEDELSAQAKQNLRLAEDFVLGWLPDAGSCPSERFGG